MLIHSQTNKNYHCNFNNFFFLRLFFFIRNSVTFHISSENEKEQTRAHTQNGMAMEKVNP